MPDNEDKTNNATLPVTSNKQKYFSDVDDLLESLNENIYTTSQSLNQDLSEDGTTKLDILVSHAERVANKRRSLTETSKLSDGKDKNSQQYLADNFGNDKKFEDHKFSDEQKALLKLVGRDKVKNDKGNLEIVETHEQLIKDLGRNSSVEASKESISNVRKILLETVGEDLRQLGTELGNAIRESAQYNESSEKPIQTSPNHNIMTEGVSSKVDKDNMQALIDHFDPKGKKLDENHKFSDEQKILLRNIGRDKIEDLKQLKDQLKFENIQDNGKKQEASEQFKNILVSASKSIQLSSQLLEPEGIILGPPPPPPVKDLSNAKQERSTGSEPHNSRKSSILDKFGRLDDKGSIGHLVDKNGNFKSEIKPGVPPPIPKLPESLTYNTLVPPPSLVTPSSNEAARPRISAQKAMEALGIVSKGPEKSPEVVAEIDISPKSSSTQLKPEASEPASTKSKTFEPLAPPPSLVTPSSNEAARQRISAQKAMEALGIVSKGPEKSPEVVAEIDISPKSSSTQLKPEASEPASTQEAEKSPTVPPMDHISTKSGSNKLDPDSQDKNTASADNIQGERILPIVKTDQPAPEAKPGIIYNLKKFFRRNSKPDLGQSPSSKSTNESKKTYKDIKNMPLPPIPSDEEALKKGEELKENIDKAIAKKRLEEEERKKREEEKQKSEPKGDRQKDLYASAQNGQKLKLIESDKDDKLYHFKGGKNNEETFARVKLKDEIKIKGKSTGYAELSFKAEKDKNVTIKIQRINEKGELMENSFDILQYENGKLSSVEQSKEGGTSRVKNIDNLLEQEQKKEQEKSKSDKLRNVSVEPNSQNKPIALKRLDENSRETFTRLSKNLASLGMVAEGKIVTNNTNIGTRNSSPSLKTR